MHEAINQADQGQKAARRLAALLPSFGAKRSPFSLTPLCIQVCCLKAGTSLQNPRTSVALPAVIAHHNCSEFQTLGVPQCHAAAGSAWRLARPLEDRVG